MLARIANGWSVVVEERTRVDRRRTIAACPEQKKEEREPARRDILADGWMNHDRDGRTGGSVGLALRYGIVVVILVLVAASLSQTFDNGSLCNKGRMACILPLSL